MQSNWNAEKYTQFLDARTRPARDLLAAIPDSFSPEVIYDLGCGPGNSSILLKQRWPHATVVGVDSSSNMLQQARSLYPDIEFIEADIHHFECDQKIDLIFSNAALQWLGDHQTLIPALADKLSAQGVLAVQIPNNFHASTHQVTIELLQNNPNWTQYLKNLRYGKLIAPFYSVNTYYDLFEKASLSELNFWETIYRHPMDNHQAIYEWVRGTGLRPVITAMSETEKSKFIEHYVQKISNAYPVQANGKVLLPFQRMFMVGVNHQSDN